MTDPLLDALVAQLVTDGIARNPRVAGSLPPIWREPRNGTPAPGEAPPKGGTTEIGTDAVLAVWQRGGPPYGPYVDGVLRVDLLDFRIRVRRSPDAKDIADALFASLGDKRDFLLGGTVRVTESLERRRLFTLGSDAQAFDYGVEYSVERSR